MIRLAKKDDIIKIQAIYKDGRELIASYGSPQWQNNYPSLEVTLSDIEKNALYVLGSDEILGVMTVLDYESTYDVIEGQWLSDRPYKVIHRIATKKGHYGKGISAQLIEYVFTHLNCNSLRIDTHELNVPMQNLLKKLDFTYCGKIYLNQATDRMRLAYQKDI